MLKLKSRQTEPEEFFTPIQRDLIKKLSQYRKLTRRELVKLLNKPRTTIYDNLLKLQKRNVVEKRSKANGLRGRPFIYWKLKEQSK